jgi:hypothetical protein
MGAGAGAGTGAGTAHGFHALVAAAAEKPRGRAPDLADPRADEPEVHHDLGAAHGHRDALEEAGHPEGHHHARQRQPDLRHVQAYPALNVLNHSGSPVKIYVLEPDKPKRIVLQTQHHGSRRACHMGWPAAPRRAPEPHRTSAYSSSSSGSAEKIAPICRANLRPGQGQP